MTGIQTILIEEHNEAYLAIAYAKKKKYINMENNSLLHVDEHHDLANPVLDKSTFNIHADLGTIHKCTYEQLRVSDFIIPLAYQNVIKKMYWLSRNHKNQKLHSVSLSIDTGAYHENMVFSTTPYNFKKKNKQLHLYNVSINTIFKPEASTILNIDLDYFSCDDNAGEHSVIEITADAYYNFKTNNLHPWKLKFGNRVNVKSHGGRYYLVHNEYDGPLSDRKADMEEINQEVLLLGRFLKINNIKPKLIIICRSHQSGYTPKSQWEFIENKLFAMLTELYELNVTHINEINERITISN